MSFFHVTTRTLSCCLVMLGLVGSGVAQKITVWVDEAHTGQIQVDKLDPDQIADPTSFSLGGGISIGPIGISIGWSREQGVEYDQKAQQLIEQIRDLCKEFNAGQLSVETYQRRIRQIFNAIEAARMCAMELAVQLSLEANKAHARLDEALGLPALDAQYEKLVGKALDDFKALANDIQPQDMPAPTDAEGTEPPAIGEPARGKSALQARMADLDAALRPPVIRSKGDRKLINIWKDRSRTVRVAVPMLDVEGLVQEFEHGLCLNLKASLLLVSVCLGRDIHWTVQTRAKYDEAAQILIVKYRKLCLEYNGNLICQEEYFERLAELIEAERRAFAAREELHRQLDESKAAMQADLEKRLGAPNALASELQEEMEKKRRAIESIEEGRRPASVIQKLSEGHRADMQAFDTFVASAGEFRAPPPSDTIDVWVDDRRERKVNVPRLDTDVIAATVTTRLSLHICFFNLGPECAWAKTKGLEYGHAAQIVILKCKRLCMDYNAGLISQETYLRESRRIDASIDKAAEMRKGMLDFYAALKSAAFGRADQMFERERNRGRR